MNDRELIQLAAMASDIPWQRWDHARLRSLGHLVLSSDMWNPLDDDGDALRLAVKLELHVFGSKIGGNVNDDLFVDSADCGNDSFAATRRAIVIAAADIGKRLTGG